jgi:carboxypeptidase Taq
MISSVQMSAIQNLKNYCATLSDINNSISILSWDQNTYLPPKAHPERGQQIATLASILHDRQTSPKLQKLIAEAEDQLYHDSPDADHALVRVMRRTYNQSTKLPPSFVEEFANLTSQAHAIWTQARLDDKFSDFAPVLDKIIQMSKAQAEYLGYSDHPYNALLDIYEEGLTVTQVQKVFDPLVSKVSQILAQAKNTFNQSFSPPAPLAITKQQQFTKKLLQTIGYDFGRGREDLSAHPFTTMLGHNDRRVTNRYSSGDITSVFTAMHEGGHALYEQGIDESLARTPLGEGTSLVIHESQSRLWENLVGKNRHFWQFLFSQLQEYFPEVFLSQYSDRIYHQLHQVKPSLIRTEADEVTYPLHIVIRFEIEKLLLEDQLQTSEIPQYWNTKYKQYLDVDVPSDREGCLQDVHWSMGGIGYFPTYALGTIMSVQVWNQLQSELLDVPACLSSGDLAPIHNWLTDKIYQYGSTYTLSEVLQRVCHSDLQIQPFLDYLQNKYTTPNT